jgi:hypothetical protein
MDTTQIYQEQETAQGMAEAAAAFLAGLNETQRAKALLDFADETQRTDWHYIPRDRAGLPLKEMDPAQQQRAHALVAAGLSTTGYQKAKTIISLEPILAVQEGTGRRFPRDAELYYVSVFGTPGSSEPWGWRFEGHHISLNYTIVDGYMVGPLPTFFGSNPAEVRHGDQQGLRALKEEEDLGRQLLMDLDGDQRKLAIISAEAPADIVTVNLPYVGDEVQPEGLAAKDMSVAQQQVLQALIEVYVRRLPDQLAEVELGKLQRSDLAQAHFAWAGVAERGGPHYYRIQGADYMAEYDNTQNDANHIHAVWRDLSNDFGGDLLRQHYQRDH